MVDMHRTAVQMPGDLSFLPVDRPCMEVLGQVAGPHPVGALAEAEIETLARSDGEAEEVVYADLTREMFLEGRAKNAFKDRRPELYGPLTELL